MPYNSAADSFRTTQLLADLLRDTEPKPAENGHFAFLIPLWRLRGRYDVDHRLILKRLVDFLLVIINFFRWVLLLMSYERISNGSRHF